MYYVLCFVNDIATIKMKQPLNFEINSQKKKKLEVGKNARHRIISHNKRSSHQFFFSQVCNRSIRKLVANMLACECKKMKLIFGHFDQFIAFFSTFNNFFLDFSSFHI